jgi:hypothetical protein
MWEGGRRNGATPSPQNREDGAIRGSAPQPTSTRGVHNGKSLRGTSR